MKWIKMVAAMELKKSLTYRVHFWVQFVGHVGAELLVAYFLWKAVFETRNTTSIGGFSLLTMTYYYLFSACSLRIVRGGEGEAGYISTDIYDGSLTRYLLYPLPFLGFKYVAHLAQQGIGILQLLLVFLFVSTVIGFPNESSISLFTLMAGIATSLFVGYLYYLLQVCIEMVAFWQDVVWNLMAMFRMTTIFFGGAVLPLAFFPDWGRTVAHFTPFPLLISYPVKTFLGQITLFEWLESFALFIGWVLFLTLLSRWIWTRGVKQYSGVGI